jgi:signal transduction histidine kinase
MSLSAAEHLPLNLLSFASWQGTSAAESGNQVLPSIYVQPLNSSDVAGYLVINDVNNKSILVLQATMPRDTYNQGLTTIGFLDISTIAISVGFSAVMLLLMERVVLSRLHRLDADVTKITNQEVISGSLQISGDDAISSLSRSINRMVAEIDKKTQELRKSERFSAIGELATMVAHDLRNPLQGIANAAFYLKRSPAAGPKEKEMIGLIEEDVKYSDKIISDLLDYSRTMRLEINETDPQALVMQSLSMIAVPPSIVLHNEVESKTPLKLDVDKIRRAIVNIVTNAIDAMPNGGSLLIRTVESESSLQFIFSDTGVGMSKEVMQRIFTPLYTTKAKGMGFGLSICKRIIEAHGGHIAVDSTPGRGTTFTITLPKEVKPNE